VAVGTGKEDEFAGAISGGFGVWEKSVAGYDERGGVRGAASLGGNSTCVRAGEAEEVGKCLCCGFFNYCESWRDLIDMELAELSRVTGLILWKAYIGI
jgi:hypothetical protein